MLSQPRRDERTPRGGREARAMPKVARTGTSSSSSSSSLPPFLSPIPPTPPPPQRLIIIDFGEGPNLDRHWDSWPS